MNTVRSQRNEANCGRALFSRSSLECKRDIKSCSRVRRRIATDMRMTSVLASTQSHRHNQRVYRMYRIAGGDRGVGCLQSHREEAEYEVL